MSIPEPGTDSLDDLLARYGPQLRAAVDDHEVAVLLEVEGLTDDLVAERYGVEDVFTLAHQLRRRLGPAPRRPSPPRRDWYVSPGVALLRGCTFSLAGLLTMTAVALGAGSAAVTVVLVTNAVGIAVLQAVAFLGYLVLERGGRGTDPSVLRPLLALFGMPVVVGVVTAVATDATTGLLAAVALAYLVAMVLLLVAGRPVVVASVVLPVSVLAVLDALELEGAPDPTVTVVAWLVGCVALVVVTCVVTRPTGRRVPLRLGWIDVRAALPFLAAGLCVGAVVLVGVGLAGRTPLLDGAGSRQWLIAALPFLVPVSVAELLVVQLRRGLLLATATTSDPVRFRRLARSRSVGAWSVHAAVVLLSAGVAAAVVVASDWPRSVAALAIMALLSTVLTAGLLLLAGDRVGLVILLLGGTSVVLAALWWWSLEHPEPASRFAVVALAVAAFTGTTAASASAGQVGSYR